jgi:Na+/H+-dicarboxylate symporter
LVTTNGSNAAPALATLIVAPSVAAAIPTLSEWALITLTAVLILFGVAGIRRRTGRRPSTS